MESQTHPTPEIQLPQPEIGLKSPKPSDASFFKSLRNLTSALASTAILATPALVHADEPKDQKPITAPSVANIDRKAINNAPKHAPGHESHLKHNTLKLAAMGSIEKHPSFGAEVSWSYMPNIDDSKKLHLVITPIDLFVAQHHLEVEGENENQSDIKTAPKYFAGATVGFTYLLNQHLELEAGLGGGIAAIPYFTHSENNEPTDLHYQFAPVVKADLQVVFIVNPHFRTYLAYSPEFVPTKIPHAMKGDEVEKETHLSHMIGIGIGTGF